MLFVLYTQSQKYICLPIYEQIFTFVQEKYLFILVYNISTYSTYFYIIFRNNI